MTRKVSLPAINMNNPHNMWTDIGQTVVYQTQWLDTKLTVFNRTTGALVQNIDVGEAPAHVMTRVDTDQVHVSINGEDSVVELSPFGAGIDRRIATQFPNEQPAQPHAHWMSFDGHTMVTPNSNTNDSTRIDIPSGSIVAKTLTGVMREKWASFNVERACDVEVARRDRCLDQRLAHASACTSDGQLQRHD